MAENINDHDQLPGFPQGIEGQRQVLTMLFNAFPDQKYSIDAVIAEGDKVVIRSTLRGTHKGEFLGIPPTMKPVEMTGTDIVRVQNGKWTEHWGVFDAVGMMQQIGAIPAPGH